MAEHIVAVFETDAAASAAAQSLKSAGIPLSAIRQYAATGLHRQGVESAEHTSSHTSGGGFWSWLFGEASSSETTRPAYTDDAYDRRALAGDVVLSVTIEDDAKIHQAIVALEAHDPIDIDERSDEVDEGKAGSSMAPLTGSSTTGQDFSSGEVAQAGMTNATPPNLHSGVAAAPVSATSLDATLAIPDTSPAISDPGTGGEVSKGEQVIPLSEEQLEVGKRTVDLGTTRVRRYVVEKPVEQTVTLQSERVLVERRQPIETSTVPSASTFEERVVEMHETEEEPIVTKTAQVVEEVVVSREATERTETVKDTVRREEVEIHKDDTLKQ